jgi:hypothetical protein
MTANTFRIVRGATIPATAARVYGIIADYRHGHPRILPAPWFGNLRVLEGGAGAGTRFLFDVTVLGKTQTSEGVVTEPAPGRELVETYPATGVVTTFRVEPLAGGASRVTFDTLMPRRPGLAGLLERLATPAFLRRVYDAELAQLARVAAEPAPPAA